MSKSLELVYGAGTVGWDNSWFAEAMDMLDKHGVKTIDTAQLYKDSESTLRKFKAPDRFAIHTKFRGGFKPADEPYEDIEECARASFAALGVESVDTYYLHGPTYDHTMGEMLASFDKLHKAGLFRRFGISNVTAADVDRMVAICDAKGYVKPTVYQANYNPVGRHIETDLLPTLRRHGIAVHVYSPLAGGFVVKTPQQIQQGQGTHFDSSISLGQLYNKLYKKPALLAWLKDWGQIAADAGVSKAELAYRWIVHHSLLEPSKGDALLLGASSAAQLETTFKYIEQGPLDDATVSRIEARWQAVKDDAIKSNFEGGPAEGWTSHWKEE